MSNFKTSAAQDLTLAGLVHDLNNVFETLSEASELLSADPQWNSLAGAINRAVEQGRRITVSFQESAETVEVESILDNSITSAQDFLLTTHRLPLRFSRKIDAGIRLAGKSGAWERVFVNLFLNASQAMPKGGDIEISARRQEHQIEITVSDNGPGISRDIIDRVFTPGFSTNSTRSGLGLSIVDSIIQSHNGTIQATNGHPCGACFTISVPDLQIPIAREQNAVAAESIPQADINQRS